MKFLDLLKTRSETAAEFSEGEEEELEDGEESQRFEHAYLLQDLECWKDIQEAVMTRDMNQKRRLSNEIRDSWMKDGNYFFNNPDSPASIEDQKRVARYAGGWKIMQKSTPRQDVLRQ